MNFIWEECLYWQFALPVYRMLSINALLQPHVFNSSFYFLSLVRAKKKGKNLYQFFIQKLRVRVICECVLYSNKYGMFNLLCPKRSIHKIAVALILKPCKCQALVVLVRNKSDTLEQNWRELKLWRQVGIEFQSFEPLWKKELCKECVLQEGSWTFVWKREE